MQELGALEAELGAAVQAGQADAFVSYLYGLVLSDRCAPAPLSPASAMSARLAERALPAHDRHILPEPFRLHVTTLVSLTWNMLTRVD